MTKRIAWLIGALVTMACVAQDATMQPDYVRSYSNISSALRSSLLLDYDKVVPPVSQRHAYVNYSSAGTDVRLEIRFFKIESVLETEGRMRLKVWLRMRWQDERLAWNPEEWGGVTQTFFQAVSLSSPEETEIWVPDVQPYNTAQGIITTLDPSIARVTHEGQVFWSRPGIIDVLCRFSGLVAFPFDQPSCALEIGGWMVSGGHQGIALEGKGWSDAQQEATAGASYQEFSIDSVSVERHVFSYSCCPSEPWPVLRYNFSLRRASSYYVVMIIYPSLLITFLSLSVFFMSPGLTERLSYATTLLLVQEVSKVTIAGLVPVCGELLWVEMFSNVCTIFCTSKLLSVRRYVACHTGSLATPPSVCCVRRTQLRSWSRALCSICTTIATTPCCQHHGPICSLQHPRHTPRSGIASLFGFDPSPLATERS